MNLEIIPSDMAFDVSKFPLCNIKKWTLWWQVEVDVSNILKKILYFTKYVKRDIVYEDEPLFVKARND